ncbi:MAG: fluoride efflux transporter CrcB [Nevskiales bacterium]|nr:fluoride efflux transporter CrcB [Nevskiales bacterium]
MMAQYLAVAAGGAIGAVTRFTCVRAVTALAGPAFPYGTLSVNVLGSLVAGVLYVRLVEQGAASAPWLGLLIVGFLGAFTTFSAFSVETLRLFEDISIYAALTNILLNVSLCLVACGSGLWLTRQFFSA